MLVAGFDVVLRKKSSWQILFKWLFIKAVFKHYYKQERVCRPLKLTSHQLSGYAVHALEKNSVGFDSSDIQRRTTASSAVFFRPLHGSFMGKPCGNPSGLPGSFVTGLSTRAVSPTLLTEGSENSKRYKGVGHD